MSLANGFLPITAEEVRELGVSQLDFIYVTGDAYVDHPTFGHAITEWVSELQTAIVKT